MSLSICYIQSMKTTVSATIIKYVSDETQPKLIEAQLTDAFGATHTITDKTAILLKNKHSMTADSTLPIPITVGCEILSELGSHVTIRLDHNIETKSGLSELTVNKSSLIS